MFKFLFNDRYNNGGEKERAAKYYEDNKFEKKMEEINIETCLKKKRKWKGQYGRDSYRNVTEENRQPSGKRK